MKDRVFVVDGNWYLHRAFFTINSSRPMADILPYHFLNMVLKDAVAVRAKYLLLAFDGPSVFRYDIYSQYKESRRAKKGLGNDDSPDRDLYQYYPQIFELCKDLGVIYFQPKRHEADDVLRSCAKVWTTKTTRFIGGTQDKDAFQYLLDGVVLYDSAAKGKDGKSKPRYITAEKAEAKLGVTIDQMIDYQTLIGDKGDDVPPIKGMRSDRARKILTEYGSIRNWYEESKADRPFINSQKANLRRNRKLVTLVEDCLPPNDLEELKMPKTKSKNKYIGRYYHIYHDFLWPKTKKLF